jgi:hypothetical protein
VKGGSNSQKFFTAQQTTANAARAKPRPGQYKAKKLGRKTLLHSHSLNLVEAVHFTGFQMNGRRLGSSGAADLKPRRERLKLTLPGLSIMHVRT